MNKLIISGANYLVSFFVTTFLVIYVLNVPTLITGNKTLVKEYYYKKYLSSLILDLFLIFIYLLCAHVIYTFLELKNILSKLGVVILVTLAISGLFGYYFLSKPMDSSFFSRWFHSVKYWAVLYDIILLSCAYLIFMYMEKLVNL